MNLEQIDTSTTAGKAEVMRLAAEGRRVAMQHSAGHWIETSEPGWIWERYTYQIIINPPAPKEVWILADDESGDPVDRACYRIRHETSNHPTLAPATAVRYIRADLAGEKGAESREERLARYRQTITGGRG